VDKETAAKNKVESQNIDHDVTETDAKVLI
jgi:hypothetical protein